MEELTLFWIIWGDEITKLLVFLGIFGLIILSAKLCEILNKVFYKK